MTALPSLFDPVPGHPIGVRRAGPQTEADQLAAWVAPALASDLAEPLLALAARAATAILDAQGSVCVWEVRIALGQHGKLENAGKESLDALGALGRRMGLKAFGRERPPLWAMQLLEASHGNVGTRWVRPRPTLLGPTERLMVPTGEQAAPTTPAAPRRAA